MRCGYSLLGWVSALCYLSQRIKIDTYRSGKVNNRRNDSDDLVLLGIAIAVIVVCLFVWKFSTAVSLDFHAGGSLLLGTIMGIAILGAGWWQENNYGSVFTVKNVLPASLAVVWLGFWPALQQWGSVGLSFPGEVQDVEWWANGFTRWGVLLIIVLGGYSYVHRTRDGY
ncbi:hypothetical protein ALP15_200094 [Pseudomonas savastanoi]|uniref:Uncharacterized protein n=1 Tax=Pseudomonas savastanoi TaxID=29438 RepID=A0A3M6ADW5_PSESS|nr:hypothetical protein ALO74_200092 [Pseudomonas syringae pv. cunninghamiae]RMV17521.1 hypothetical protein ALP15_200094 [Pseudomonas savastanoi]